MNFGFSGSPCVLRQNKLVQLLSCCDARQLLKWAIVMLQHKDLSVELKILEYNSLSSIIRLS
jgi:hypothetical protein